MRRSLKSKKDSQDIGHFALLESGRTKAARNHVDEIDPRIRDLRENEWHFEQLFRIFPLSFSLRRSPNLSHQKKFENLCG